MNTMDIILWSLLVISVAIAYTAWMVDRPKIEGFIDKSGSLSGVSLSSLSAQALDAAPTTSEVKGHYRKLLIFSDDDIRKQGTSALRLLADLRDRLFDRPNFRDSLVVDDFLAGWPSWLTPLNKDIKEPIPTRDEAVMAESKILAYLQKNFPQADSVDEDTGSTVRNLYTDFGKRFVFDQGEPVALKADFMKQPLLKGWKNPLSER